MTIGMLVESMAAKAGALRGEFVDATPFKSSVQQQDKNVVDQFGEQLAAAGFNYYGNEVGSHGWRTRGLSSVRCVAESVLPQRT